VLDVHLLARVAAMQSSAAANRTAETAERLLIADVSAGSRAALAKLYVLYAARLAAFFRHLTSNADLVQELICDTMLNVWQERASIDPNVSVPVWVMSLAYKHTCRLLAAPAPSRPQKSPPRLHDAVLDLSFDERTVLYLVYAGGHSRQDICDIMSVSSRGVDTLLTSARLRLRALSHES